MASPKTGGELIKLLSQSQILSEDFLNKLRPQVKCHEDGDARRLAKILIKNSVVTEYQAKQLLAGRYKGFYIGKYKIMATIGAGGMGKVFLAEQITMERLVALKVVGRVKKKSREKEILARFKREAKAVAALHHENIVHAYDFDEENSIPYIVMEFVEGIDTAAMVKHFGPVKWKQACEYIRQAANGLQHAHDAGLVHRDIKPGNLLVDRKGTVKILDLGLCSTFGDQQDDSLTVDQDQLGTVDYIAPEQAVDPHSADHRADIYSLGATFYSLLCGRILYPDKSTAQKLLLHQTTAPQPLSKLVKELPKEVEEIVGKMLEKDPENRYQSGKEIAAALEKLAEVKSPAYDDSVIKYKRTDFEPLIGRAPDSNDITIQSLKDSSSVASESGNAVSLSQVSQINMDNAFAEVDPLTMLGDFTELGMLLPPRKKKKGKKRKKTAALSGGMLTLIGGASVLALLIIVGTMLISTPVLSTENKSPPNPNSINKANQNSGAKKGNRVTFSEWIENRKTQIENPNLLAYYTFQSWELNGDQLRNVAVRGNFKPLDISQADWGKGRWESKGAVRFQGHRSGQLVAFKNVDSKKLNFQTSTSVMVWFKVEKFDTPWQAIIGKGDFTWRLQRFNNSNKLAFCMNKPAPAGSGKKYNPDHVNSLMRLEGRTNVNDGKWHQAIIVFDTGPKTPEMRLYLDGVLENRMNAEPPHVNNKNVWIGANSETHFIKAEEDVKEGVGIRSFNGSIDEVAIFSAALSTKAVLDLYRAGKP